MQKVLVQKYGGSSVSDVTKIANVAKNIERSLKNNHKIAVVVSAMGTYTDELLDLAKGLNPDPPKRELDMLVTTGERISTALLGIALAKLGISARSLTGSQSGILTDEIHGNARICNIRPDRVARSLDEHGVVIVAGFQGVSPLTKDITSLGRGGSDLSAIALCAALEGSCCEIYTDVPGVMTADPRMVPTARTMPHVPWPVMSALAWAGAGVLHHRGAYVAAKYRIPLKILSTHSDPDKITEIYGDQDMESPRVFSIATRKKMTLAKITCRSNPQSVSADCLKWLWANEISPAVFEWHFAEGGFSNLVCLMESDGVEKFTTFFHERLGIEKVDARADLGVITVVGQGFRQSPELAEQVLGDLGIRVAYFSYQDNAVCLAVEPSELEEGVQRLHARFFPA